jgi:hypothetical protein
VSRKKERKEKEHALREGKEEKGTCLERGEGRKRNMPRKRERKKGNS